MRLKRNNSLAHYSEDEVVQEKEILPSMCSILRGFTPRELQVYELVVRGKCNKEVAAGLGMTTRTVRFHLSNIFIKAGVTSRIELICRAANMIERSSNSAAISSVGTGHHASYNGA